MFALFFSPLAIVLDDCNFHDCVDRSQWDSDRTLLFYPPDGEFRVINYRCEEIFKFCLGFSLPAVVLCMCASILLSPPNLPPAFPSA